MMELFPVTSLSRQVNDLLVTITPPAGSTTQEGKKESIGEWTVAYMKQPCNDAPLVFCPNPPPGLTEFQFREQTTYDVWIEGGAVGSLELCLGDQERTGEAKISGQTLYWPLNWGNYVGASVIHIRRGKKDEIRLPVEVRSRKVGYLGDYRVMLDDISERLAALIFDYGSPTAVYAQRATFDEHVAYLDYLFLRYLMAERRLPLHFRIVAASPHRATERETVWADLSLARSFTPRSLYALYAYPERLVRPRQAVAPTLQRQLRGYAPSQVLDDRVVTTFDTPPNRFVRHFLVQLVRKLRELESVFGPNTQSARLAADCRRWRGSIENLARAHFMEKVGEMHFHPASSQVLLKREGYRQLNDYYRRFLLTGKVMWEGFAELIKTPNKNMATLYEYWCFFQLLDAVATALGVQVDPRQFIVEKGGTFKVTIDQSGKSHGRVGQTTVYYNHSFCRSNDKFTSYSVTLHPDYAIRLPSGKLIVLDAKYKYQDPSQFMSTDGDTKEEQSEEERLIYKKGDLYKMHTYRDALKAQAVFVLYPGTKFCAFRVDGQQCNNSPSSLGPDFAGVGAVALHPEQTKDLELLIRTLIHGS